MYLSKDRTTARSAVVAAGILAALTMTALPAYAEDPAPSPSDSPSPSESPSADPEPSASPSESPAPEKPSESPTVAPTDPSPSEPGPGEEEPPRWVDLAVAAPGSKVTVGSEGKWVRIDVDNMGADVASNVKLTLQTGDLTDVTVELPGEDQDCVVDGTTSVCTYPDLDPGDVDTYVAFKVTPKPDAKLGVAGKVTASVTSDGKEDDPSNNTAELQIELVGPGPDLTSYAAPVGPVRPGKSEPLYFGVVNQGDQPTSGLTVTVRLPAYASFVERYDECTYSGRSVTCSAPDLVLAPGEGIDLSEAFTVKVSKRAPGPLVLGRGSVTASGEAAEATVTKVGGGSLLGRTPRASLRAASGDMVPGDDTVTFPVKTSKNQADLKLAVSRAEGAVGDVVKVRFTVTNNGPADASGFGFTIRLKHGTTIDSDPSNAVECSFLDIYDAACHYEKPFPSGAKVSFTFEFKIEKLLDGAAGTAKVHPLGYEANLKNNTAPIVIGAPGSGGGGGGGGGGLPVTGTPLAGLVGGGVAAVLLGFVLFLAARWRRTGLVGHQA